MFRLPSTFHAFYLPNEENVHLFLFFLPSKSMCYDDNNDKIIYYINMPTLYYTYDRRKGKT